MAELSFFNIGRRLADLDLSQGSVTVDLRDVTFIHPFAVAYLGAFLRHYENRVRFDFQFNETSRFFKYLTRHRFFTRFEFDADSIEAEERMRDERPTSLNDIVNIVRDPEIGSEIADSVFQLLHDNRVQLENDEVSVQIGEVVDNFSLHAEESVGTFLVQYFPNLHYFKVAIADTGIGIRKSLSQNKRYEYLLEKPSRWALEKAFEPEVSSRKLAGMGLYDLREYLIEHGGHLYCSSEDGYYMIERGQIRTGVMKCQLPGVQMEFGLPERRS
ncbi:MAG: ATP-binding protein [Candidatus Omnitrophica bacterium]|nr:ATP-binding protein [Candidatus Omnitrophota bacterium]